MENRIIKFRCWDKIIEKMNYPTNHCPNGVRGDLNDHSEMSHMQFIGLKDKDKKEIYRCDIVSVHQFLFDGNEIEKEWIGEIVYIEDFNCCGFGFKVISGDFALSHTGYNNFEEIPPLPMSNIYGLHDESFEVIGNVFEKNII